jgi:hypothetical protein
LIILEESFKAAYHDGLQIHVWKLSAEIQIDALGMDLKEMRQRLDRIKKQADEMSKQQK